MVDAELRQLGRRHNAEQARTAIEACIAAGFHTVSVDIMFGLPGQSRESLQETLTDVAALQPQHVSCYQLTVHEGTTFGRWRERGKLHEMGEDDQAARFAQVHDQLAVAGLVAYEVSNYAADPVHQSAHNQKYWRHTPYLGLGPSAHSFDGESRWWNVRPLDEYATRISRGETPIADREQLSAADTALETVMLRIRTKEGIDLDAFEQRFGYRLESDNANLIARLKLDGYLLQDNPKRLQPTRTGLAVADGIAAQLAIRE